MVYISDAAHLALCDLIADSEVLCREFDLRPDPLTGFVECDRVAFELGARLDLWPARHRCFLEIEAALEGIRELALEFAGSPKNLRPDLLKTNDLIVT